jgi:hypothetical protein
MSSHPLLSTLLLCTLLSPSLASYYPPPVPDSDPMPQYESNFTRVNGLAPLFGMDSKSRVQDCYGVYFVHDDDDYYSAGYSLDDHWAYIGQDLSSQTHEFYTLKHGYRAEIPDVELLERVRADGNVSFVEVEQLIEPSGMPGTE